MSTVDRARSGCLNDTPARLVVERPASWRIEEDLTQRQQGLGVTDDARFIGACVSQAAHARDVNYDKRRLEARRYFSPLVQDRSFVYLSWMHAVDIKTRTERRNQT